MDNHIDQCDHGKGKHPDMIGNAVAATVLAAYTAEIALKTLHAQTKPGERPPKGHCLLGLYDKLGCDVKIKAQEMLSSLPLVGDPNWIEENPDIRELIKQGNSNFLDWKYPPEKDSMEDGVPKVMVNVVQVMHELCLQYVVEKANVVKTI